MRSYAAFNGIPLSFSSRGMLAVFSARRANPPLGGLWLLRRAFAAGFLPLMIAGCSGMVKLQKAILYSATRPGSRMIAREVTTHHMGAALRPGDVAVVDLRAYEKSLPRRGDIVGISSPSNPEDVALDRIVGVPGDRASIQGGWLWLNGRRQNEPYVVGPANYDLSIDHYRLVSRYPDAKTSDLLDGPLSENPPRQFWQSPDRIPKDFYLVLGDDRNASVDSHIFGLINLHEIAGKVVKVF